MSKVSLSYCSKDRCYVDCLSFRGLNGTKGDASCKVRKGLIRLSVSVGPTYVQYSIDLLINWIQPVICMWPKTWSRMAGVDTMDWKTRYEGFGVYVILTGQTPGGDLLLK